MRAGSPFFFSILFAVRSYIDLSHTFDLQASEEDHAILQSIPLLFPIDSILRSPACNLDELSTQTLNSSIKVGQSLWLRPFEMRLEFWKGLIDRAYDGDGDSGHKNEKILLCNYHNCLLQLLWHFFQHSLQTVSVRHGTSLMYLNSLSRRHGHQLVLFGPLAPVLIGFNFGNKLWFEKWIPKIVVNNLYGFGGTLIQTR
ncbi:hypothetical protein DFJ73DRAFT_890140 [Zopfochytrium polystomum]|nr:hypothetical protein DFJ73DRAFT_890140 [Zopfochytrium polystomum]